MRHFRTSMNADRKQLGDIISGWFVRPIVLDKCVKSRVSCLNRSQEILPEAVGGDIFDSFFSVNFDQKLIMTSYPMWL